MLVKTPLHCEVFVHQGLDLELDFFDLVKFLHGVSLEENPTRECLLLRRRFHQRHNPSTKHQSNCCRLRSVQHHLAIKDAKLWLVGRECW